MTQGCVVCTAKMAPDIRSLVDKALESRGLDLLSFVADRRDQGRSVKEITEELNLVTGIPITWRTLYRWLEAERTRA